MTIPFQFTAKDAPHRYVVSGATTVKPVGRIRFPNSPRMVSSRVAIFRPVAMPMRNLADSFCHFLLNSGALPVTITGEHSECRKNGKTIPEIRNGVSVVL